MSENIRPQDITAGTRFVVNGTTYTADTDARPIGNGRKYHVQATTAAIVLRASDTVRRAA